MIVLRSFHLSGDCFSRKGWGKGTDVLNAVSDCMIRRLSTKEALSRLKSPDFPMSEAEFR